MQHIEGRFIVTGRAWREEDRPALGAAIKGRLETAPRDTQFPSLTFTWVRDPNSDTNHPTYTPRFAASIHTSWQPHEVAEELTKAVQTVDRGYRVEECE
ncbi:hypothetical protein [Micromonospora chalcea]|uniref:hypothetical protein n=1 Tax=Micromonospora chalcea TaxID=1874 RepID=UPI003D715DF1